MADLSDITAYLTAQAALACYPLGPSQPSVVPGQDIKIYEGWPNAAQLDLDVQGLQLTSPGLPPTKRPHGPASNVSIYPMAGATVVPYQIEDSTYIIVPPTYGMAVTPSSGVSGTTLTVTGQPGPSEYLSIVADRSFVYSRGGASTAAILAALAADASANYAGVVATANTITIPFRYSFVVRIGAMGTLGKATWRQRHGIMLTTWAPDHTSRATIAAAIDNFLKRTITAVMPDTSMARFCYSRTTQTDEQQTAIIYRRDLIFDVDYATVFEFPGYVITSFNGTLQAGNWSLPEQLPPNYYPIA